MMAGLSSDVEPDAVPFPSGEENGQLMIDLVESNNHPGRQELNSLTVDVAKQLAKSVSVSLDGNERDDASVGSKQCDEYEFDINMPPELRLEPHDILLLHTDDDFVFASEVKAYFESQFKNVTVLLSYVLKQMINRELSYLEEGVKVCTYVFILMTENLLECELSKYLGEACLVSSIEDKSKRWSVVPIFTEKERRNVPMVFRGLSALEYYRKNVFFAQKVGKMMEDRKYIKTRNAEKQECRRKDWREEERHRLKMEDLQRQRLENHTKAKRAEELEKKQQQIFGSSNIGGVSSTRSTGSHRIESVGTPTHHSQGDVFMSADFNSRPRQPQQHSYYQLPTGYPSEHSEHELHVGQRSQILSGRFQPVEHNECTASESTERDHKEEACPSWQNTKVSPQSTGKTISPAHYFSRLDSTVEEDALPNGQTLPKEHLTLGNIYPSLNCPNAEGDLSVDGLSNKFNASEYLLHGLRPSEEPYSERSKAVDAPTCKSPCSAIHSADTQPKDVGDFNPLNDEETRLKRATLPEMTSFESTGHQEGVIKEVHHHHYHDEKPMYIIKGCSTVHIGDATYIQRDQQLHGQHAMNAPHFDDSQEEGVEYQFDSDSTEIKIPSGPHKSSPELTPQDLSSGSLSKNLLSTDLSEDGIAEVVMPSAEDHVVHVGESNGNTQEAHRVECSSERGALDSGHVQSSQSITSSQSPVASNNNVPIKSENDGNLTKVTENNNNTEALLTVDEGSSVDPVTLRVEQSSVKLRNHWWHKFFKRQK